MRDRKTLRMALNLKGCFLWKSRMPFSSAFEDHSYNVGVKLT